MTTTLTRSIYLVDQDPACDVQLRALLGDVDYTISTFDSGAGFAAALDALAIGVVLLNLEQPDGDGLSLLRQVREARPDLPIIALCERPELPKVIEAMRLGAEYCLEKPIEQGLLSAALSEPLRQQSEMPVRVSATDIEARLTKRQFQVLRLLLAGLQNKRVGAALGISERTVEIHRSKIMRQLEVENFASLVRLATQSGIKPASSGSSQPVRDQVRLCKPG